MRYEIKLMSGEVVEMSEKEYLRFYQEYQDAKKTNDLVTLTANRRVRKGKIDEIDAIESSASDLFRHTLFRIYGTTARYTFPHQINWRQLIDVPEERAALDEIIDKDKVNIVQKLVDNYDKFTPEIQKWLHSPVKILENWITITKYMSENILEKANITKQDLVNKFKVNY